MKLATNEELTFLLLTRRAAEFSGLVGWRRQGVDVFCLKSHRFGGGATPLSGIFRQLANQSPDEPLSQIHPFCGMRRDVTATT